MKSNTLEMLQKCSKIIYNTARNYCVKNVFNQTISTWFWTELTFQPKLSLYQSVFQLDWCACALGQSYGYFLSVCLLQLAVLRIFFLSANLAINCIYFLSLTINPRCGTILHALKVNALRGTFKHTMQATLIFPPIFLYRKLCRTMNIADVLWSCAALYL